MCNGHKVCLLILGLWLWWIRTQGMAWLSHPPYSTHPHVMHSPICFVLRQWRRQVMMLPLKTLSWGEHSGLIVHENANGGREGWALYPNDNVETWPCVVAVENQRLPIWKLLLCKVSPNLHRPIHWEDLVNPTPTSSCYPLRNDWCHTRKTKNLKVCGRWNKTPSSYLCMLAHVSNVYSCLGLACMPCVGLQHLTLFLAWVRQSRVVPLWFRIL
jgi:hypothetical protein